MNRRSFIGSILALGTAPAIVRADSLMRIVPRETVLLHGGELGVIETFRFEAECGDMAAQIGARMALIREMVRYDALQAAWKRDESYYKGLEF